MKKLFFLAIFSSWTLCVFAQTDFRSGYIISHDGDTLYGLLDYREASRKYRVCAFKTSAEAQAKEFTPEQIQAYRFLRSRLFVSKSIQVDGNRDQLVFMEVLVEGRMSLFRHGNAFFVSKDDSVLYKLTNERRERIKNGRRVIVTSNRYLGLLNFLMSDCPKMKSAIQPMNLSERKLTELVAAYNACRDAPAITYKSQLPYVRAAVGIMGGISVSDMEISGDDPEYEHLQGPFEPSQSPLIGLSVDLSSPRMNQRISFYASLMYQRSRFYSYRMVHGTYYTNRHYVTIEMASLQLPIGVKYTFPERRYTTYVDAGVLSNYRLGGRSEWIKEREADNVVETYPETVSLNKNQFGFWGGIGIRRTLSPSLNIFLECRYSLTPANIDRYESIRNLSPSISSLQLFLGIRTR
jgi:hypothetical protein